MELPPKRYHPLLSRVPSPTAKSVTRTAPDAAAFLTTPSTPGPSALATRVNVVTVLAAVVPTETDLPAPAAVFSLRALDASQIETVAAVAPTRRPMERKGGFEEEHKTVTLRDPLPATFAENTSASRTTWKLSTLLDEDKKGREEETIKKRPRPVPAEDFPCMLEVDAQCDELQRVPEICARGEASHRER